MDDKTALVSQLEDVSSAARISQHYKALCHSVDLINGILAGEKMVEADFAEKQNCIKRNVEHLEVMIGKDFWTDEDMAPIDAAIAAGNAALAG